MLENNSCLTNVNNENECNRQLDTIEDLILVLV